MDEGTRLAFRAIILGLRHSGQIGSHALAVIVDELRSASREAREGLFDHDAAGIDLLMRELAEPASDPRALQPVARLTVPGGR